MRYGNRIKYLENDGISLEILSLYLNNDLDFLYFRGILGLWTFGGAGFNLWLGDLMGRVFSSITIIDEIIIFYFVYGDSKCWIRI